MGDPRRLKKKYSGPDHPWQKARLDEEKVLMREYGLKNKKELWKTSSKLKAMQAQAKKLISARGEQAEKETAQLIQRLARLGILTEQAQLNDILGLTTRDLLERRLQTLVFRKGLAGTIKQSRQFIGHEHIVSSNRVLSTPGYIVPSEEEPTLTFVGNTSLANPDHPVRAVKQPKIEVAEESETKEAEETEEKSASKEGETEEAVKEKKPKEKSKVKKPEKSKPVKKKEKKEVEAKPSEEASK